MAAKSEFIRYEDLFSTVNLAQRIIGFRQYFKKTENSNTFKNILERVFFYILCLQASYNIYSAVYTFVKILVDREEEKYLYAAELIPSTLLSMLLFWKLFRIMHTTEDVVTLLEELKDMWPSENSSDVVKKIMRDNLKPVIKLVNFYTVHTVFNVLTFFFSPFLIVYIFPPEEGEATKVLPFKLVYPIDIESSDLNYGLILVSQFLSVWLVGFSMSILDCIMVIIIVQLAMHFELLSEKLNSLTAVALKPTTLELEAMNSELNSIIRTHIHVIRISDLAQKILGPIFFAIFLLSSVLICQMLFIITLVPLDKQVNFVGLLLSLLVQVFLICYYGDKMVFQSIALCEAAYSCSWYCCDRSFRSKIILMLMRSQKPVKMTALSYASVSLETFATILRASWSYFTLLQTAAADTET